MRLAGAISLALFFQPFRNCDFGPEGRKTFSVDLCDDVAGIHPDAFLVCFDFERRLERRYFARVGIDRFRRFEGREASACRNRKKLRAVEVASINMLFGNWQPIEYGTTCKQPEPGDNSLNISLEKYRILISSIEYLGTFRPTSIKSTKAGLIIEVTGEEAGEDIAWKSHGV